MSGYFVCPPTSISFSGSSASILDNGSVSFSGVSSLSFNGVFSSLYENYYMILNCASSLTSTDVYVNLRASGSDASASNDYVSQYLTLSASTVGAGRLTALSSGWIGQAYANGRIGVISFIYGPSLVAPTVVRSVCISDESSSARLVDIAFSHDLSTAYDGLTIYPSTGTLSGRVAIYGGQK